MLRVKVENEKGTNIKWHDLMKKTGVKEAYEHIDTIFSENEDYIITDIKSDWAKFDCNTSLNDMMDTVNVLKTMIDDEIKLFKTIYSVGIHEPLDIANKVRYNEMKYIEDICEDDEVWETVFFDKEEKEIDILY